jgi:8-oxo-dGTP pyrophosphatase MutT (NUDIX family)
VINNQIRQQQSSSPYIMEPRYQDDFRAFVFATHPTYGMLLLYCTRKKSKPPHFQAPGGHVDKEDFVTSSEGGREGPALLMHACKIGASRELFEETGIDIRSQLDR